MKVKLLKKVREDYYIIKYDSIPTNWSVWDRGSFDIANVTCPFFMSFRKNDHINTHQTYDEALETIRLKIRNRYTKVIRKNNGNPKKVWY